MTILLFFSEPYRIIEEAKGLHNKIAGFYASKVKEISGNQTIREWLKGQSFEEQWQFGLDVIEQIVNEGKSQWQMCLN